MGTVSAAIDDRLIARIDEIVTEQKITNPQFSRAKMIGQLIATGLDITVNAPEYADIQQLALITVERDTLKTENAAYRKQVAGLAEEINIGRDRYARLDIQYRDIAAKHEGATILIDEMQTRFAEHSERISDLKADKVKLNADKDLLASTIIPLLEAPREVYTPPRATLRESIGALFGKGRTDA